MGSGTGRDTALCVGLGFVADPGEPLEVEAEAVL